MLAYSSPIAPPPTTVSVRGRSGRSITSSLTNISRPSVWTVGGCVECVPTAMITLSVVMVLSGPSSSEERLMVWRSTNDASAWNMSVLVLASWPRSISACWCITWFVLTIRSLIVMFCLTV